MTEVTLKKVLHNKKPVIAKVFSTQDDISKYISDIHFSLRVQKHPYIVKYIKLFHEDQKLYLIREPVDTNLAEYLRNNVLSNFTKVKFICQIGVALQYLHNGGLAYCNLSLDSISIKDDGILLVDFDKTKILDNQVGECAIFPPPEYRFNVLYNAGLVNKEYFELFDINKVKRWNKQVLAFDTWSYGLICIDIYFNRPYSVGEEVLSNYFDKHESGNYYDSFLVKIVRALKQDITFAFLFYNNHPPNNELYQIFRYICNYMLTPDQDRRPKSYISFLRRNAFKIEASKFIIKFNHTKVKDIIVKKPGVFEESDLNNFSGEIISFYAHNYPYYVVLDTLDFFLQTVNFYVAKSSELVLHVVIVIYLISSLHNQAVSIEELLNYFKLSFRPEDVKEQILTTLLNERGHLDYDNIYRYLVSESIIEFLPDILKIYQDADLYKQLGGPSGVAIKVTPVKRVIGANIMLTEGALYVNNFYRAIAMKSYYNNEILSNDMNYLFENDIARVYIREGITTESILLTNGVPFDWLGNYVKDLGKEFRDMANFNLIIDLKKSSYKPSQSRKRINFSSPELNIKFTETVILGGLLRCLSNKEYREKITGFNYKGDPNQVSSTISAKYPRYQQLGYIEFGTMPISKSICYIISDVIDMLDKDIRGELTYNHTEKHAEIAIRKYVSDKYPNVISIYRDFIIEWFSNKMFKKKNDDRNGGENKPEIHVPEEVVNFYNKLVHRAWSKLRQLLDSRQLVGFETKIHPPTVIFELERPDLYGYYSPSKHVIVINSVKYRKKKIIDDILEYAKLYETDRAAAVEFIRNNVKVSKRLGNRPDAVTLIHEFGHAIRNVSHQGNAHGNFEYEYLGIKYSYSYNEGCNELWSLLISQ